MDKSQPISSYDRLQELLAIPERQRTEDQWDEINELEITLTPVNRTTTTTTTTTSERNVRRKASAAPVEQLKPRDGAHGKRPLKKLRKRPKPGAP
jgi:hypothetical protein